MGRLPPACHLSPSFQSISFRTANTAVATRDEKRLPTRARSTSPVDVFSPELDGEFLDHYFSMYLMKSMVLLKYVGIRLSSVRGLSGHGRQAGTADSQGFARTGPGGLGDHQQVRRPYLSDVLRRPPSHPKERLAELLPDLSSFRAAADSARSNTSVQADQAESFARAPVRVQSGRF